MVGQNQVGFETRRFGLAALMCQRLIQGGDPAIENRFHASFLTSGVLTA
jgi:hypothetical protein